MIAGGGHCMAPLRGGHWPSSALHPSGGRSAPPPPGGFCGTVVPAAPDMRGGLAPSSALLPCMGAPREHGFAMLGTRVTFLRKESHQRFARDLLVPGPPAQGGGPPWIPPPSALAVLVAIAQTLKHPRRHPLPRHGLTAEGVTPGVAWGEK